MTENSQPRRIAPPVIDLIAFSGLPGEVVSSLRPHSEADEVGLLLDFLTSFGNCIGLAPYFVADGAYHRPRLNLLLCGTTARSRKGTSRRNIQRVFEVADPVWAGERVVSGLASGEGLIAALANTVPSDGNPLEGGHDPRLLASEEEFGRVLAAAGRDGSTLSPVLRQAWDGDRLRSLTRSKPLKADPVHISVIAHATVEELLKQLTSVDIANGFLNRFLIALVQRSKRLPSGGSMSDDNYRAMGKVVGERLHAARRVARMSRSAEAEELWAGAYVLLDDEVGGPVGDLIARVEAQWLRLSMIYALADGSPVIEADHLWSSAAVWDYCAASVSAIFGGRSGDPIANRLLEAIRDAGDRGLDATEQSAVFNRHETQARLEYARGHLEKLGAIETRVEITAGRSRKVSYPAKKEKQAKKVPGTPGDAGLISLLSLIRNRNGTGEGPHELGDLGELRARARPGIL